MGEYSKRLSAELRRSEIAMEIFWKEKSCHWDMTAFLEARERRNNLREELCLK